MPSTSSPEALAGLEALSDGEWMPGPALVIEMMKAIPPGEAQRYAESRWKKPQEAPPRLLIESGRRRRAVKRVAWYVGRGLWETDPPKLTRDHWAGYERWRVRDRYPGQIGLTEAAERIGVTLRVLEQWIAKGLAPQPARISDTPKAVRMVTPDLLEIYRRIAEVRPPAGGLRWQVDPRSLWVGKPGTILQCPDCGSHFRANVALEAIGDESFDAGGLPPGRSEIVESVDDGDDDDDVESSPMIREFEASQFQDGDEDDPEDEPDSASGDPQTHAELDDEEARELRALNAARAGDLPGDAYFIGQYDVNASRSLGGR